MSCSGGGGPSVANVHAIIGRPRGSPRFRARSFSFLFVVTKQAHTHTAMGLARYFQPAVGTADAAVSPRLAPASALPGKGGPREAWECLASHGWARCYAKSRYTGQPNLRFEGGAAVSCKILVF